ncbi:hypothetical protein H6P81_003987 [Aristolochia fimbriata]|uniref:Fe2OG dioxygenase domain-containing protein n=1 Tax=Aristolochia fimbriata TaxID=158543 RepID=A0AAV7FEM6_ARIFI|nr:hypothetical protein H6P81_003987 [Aristolochia fimbriata]
MANYQYYSSEDDYIDREREVKEFDDSKIGVKGLVDSGITTIPRFFVHPPENLNGAIHNPSANHDHPHQIPIIDLSALINNSDAHPGRRTRIVQQVGDAARRFGFFQIVNHGIPISVMDSTISAIKAFHQLPTEEKKKQYDRSRKGGVTYATNAHLFQSKEATWHDTLGVLTSPVSPDWERVPAVCRRELMEWNAEMKKLGEVLARLFSEGLGLKPERLEELKCLESRTQVANCYPHCPQPHLTLGLASHTDPRLFTILLQSELGGLQVKMEDGCWIDVKPMHGALVINVADLLQVISNGIYKSVEHRVLANCHKEPRVSIPVFLGPSEFGNSGQIYGPLPELVSEEKPALYRNFTIQEHMKDFFSNELAVLVNKYKLISN